MTDVETKSRGILSGTRIHALVLTRDRPETLRRCVATALSSLGAQDMLTIVDDSGSTAYSANSALLATPLNARLPTQVHLSTGRAREIIERSLDAPALLWLAKMAPRDIAPLRNLSLLLSVVVPADMTILIDDDIHGFDLVATYHRTITLATTSCGVIVGADIGGINEQDTITRLADAINRIDKEPSISFSESIRDLFHVHAFSGAGERNDSRYVSAGYLAFRLLPEQLFAFPPGYNEDWLWCLLHAANAQVRIVHSGDSVIHDPPSVLKPTRDDLRFELIGDLVFQCLEERDTCNDLNPEASLRGLASQLPRPAFMPAARALELLAMARSSSQTGGDPSVLEEYGLAIMADMLRTEELNMDGTRVVADWCSDAIAKHKSVADTMCNQAAISAIRTLLLEGRI